MLKQLIGFEINYHLRQIGFWITVGIMFLLGVAIVSMPGINFSAETGERIKANGAVVTAITIAGFSLLSIFFGAVFVVSGIMRDQVYKSLEIIHATQVSSRHMVLSRMIGVYIATFLAIFAVTIGLFAGQFMPWMDQEALGPINPLYYLQPSLIFIAINTLLVSGFFTVIAALTRNRALVYVSAVGLFIAYTMSGLFVGENSPDLLTSLSDPFGASALAIVTEFWSAAEQNTQTASLFSYVGLNRLVWGALGLVLYVVSFSLFRRGLVSGKSKKTDENDVDDGAVQIMPVRTNMAGSAIWLTFWRRFRYEYVTTVKSIPFIILTLMAVALFAMVIYVQMVFDPNPALPTSALISQSVAGSLILPVLIIIVFFSGEIIWRDKTAAIHEILDASPVKNGPLLAGKWLALIGVVVTLLLIAIGVGMIAQTVLGDVPINPLTYFTLFFVGLGWRLVLLCVLVLFIQNFMPNRVVGMLVAAAAVIFFFIAINFLPFSHPLMEYGAAGTGPWSELNGYSSLIRFSWFSLYWGALAALFIVLSVWMWRRGLQVSLLSRVRSLGKRITFASASLAVLFAGVFVASGGYIYKAYNIDNEFLTDKQRDLQQVKWEKLLGDARQDRLPKIRVIDVTAMINPSQQTATFSGSYLIENTTGEMLEQLYIRPATNHQEDIKQLELVGATRVIDGENIAEIENFDVWLYRFDSPLAPGAKTTINFETFFHAPRLGAGGQIERNGTFVNNTQVMPQLGVGDFRLRNKDKRRKHELPELERSPERDDMVARESNFISASADYVDFTAKVCTDIGQIPIAPGKMLREYQENGKVCRDYQPISPMLNFYSFLSADFEVRRDVWENPDGRDIPLAIYFHHAHDYNVDLMLGAMKSSLDTFTSVFGPYQYNQVRIMEFPYGSFAQAFAGTIPFSERIGFVMDPGDPEDIEKLDLATYVVMHEIGHQWFAHQLVAANTKGFNVLSEGLTENAAMTAYEAELGWKKARRVLENRAIQQYLTGRTVDRENEPPLALAEGQQYLDYNKASWVFWGLKQYIGEDLMQGAIRSFLQEYGSKGPLYPTSLQLVEALRAAAGPKWQQLITDYWDRIVFWELKIDGDVAVKVGNDGGFTVSFTARVDKKIAAEEDGKETSVTEIDGEEINEWVEVGFYEEDPKKTLGGDWLKLERVHISQLETELSFDMEQRPNFVLLDPRRLLIERNVDDNVKKLSKAGEDN